MRNNSGYSIPASNSLNLNNNGAPAPRYCNADNTFCYYNYDNCNLIAPTWGNRQNQNPSQNQVPNQNHNLPSKRIPTKQGARSSYHQSAANSAPDSSIYTDAFGQHSLVNQRIAGNKSCEYVYQTVRRSEDQHSNRQYKLTRPYAADKEQQPMLLQPSIVYFDPELKKRKARGGRVTSDYLDNSPDRYRALNSPSPEPTWDNILSERPAQYQTTNQHYQHYFSYFYNRGAEKLSKPTFAVANSRKLPMSKFQKPSASRRDSRDVDDTVIIGRRDNSEDRSWQSPKYEKHVLKEKLPSNDLEGDYLDNDWGDPGSGEDYRDIKEVYDPAVVIDDGLEQVHRRYCRMSENAALDDCGDALINNNNNELKVMRKATDQPVPRLPMTPKRAKGGAVPAKKPMPTVHRVLLYSTQSPRMGRKQQFTTQRLSMKPQSAKTLGGGDEGQTVILLEPEDKPEDNRSAIDFERNDDFDEDDDLDNLSNFDESDSASVLSDTEDGYRAHAYKLTHSVDRFLSPQGTPSFSSSQSSEDDLKNPESLLVPSLFPYVPPYLSFSSNTKKGPRVPPDLHRVLKWRITNIMPKVVRLILANSGMRMLKKTNDWMGVWGKHLKSPCFKAIRSYQKINHLPGSFRIGRKDSCWKNLQRQMGKHSNKEFGFMPRTYIIPNDLGALRRHWPKYAQRNTKWIIKPPASARGAGIRVINRWGQIPKRRPLIVQKYIERPLLINGSKFDLRLYVLVTSVNPLRVFMYHNGLARFASVKYSAKTDTLNDRCMHLTNYSINKFSSNYSKNEDVNACHGHKWTIKSLWTYLANRGVRTDCLWEALRSLVLRTILAGENGINSMIRANVESKYSCFELFGFDVILDSDLVPWLLEVNISPSLHSELPLDAHVKAPLVQGVLNTALYNVPPKLSLDKQKELAAEFSFPPGTQMCYDKRLYINYLSREEKVKHNTFTRKSMEDRNEYVNAILNNLTPDDVRCLIIAEDELARCAPLERIFPTDQTHKYLKYNDSPRYYNRLLDAWESRYANNRTEGIALLRDYCQNKYHLQVPTPPAKKYIEGDHTAYSLHLSPEQDFLSTSGLER
ncbi:tubulin polyglutamylase TTLL4 isoform X2 [Drosophila subpulchrella]|uniref:tubulin polyglutamylase TTLL4 isoform X2 n=1 Tax=Drosophila subpulchrella TaxID=1486046 RepID=UPI0018A18DA8|nr:tubulin polyglutamylase TTLL4 isoform X2 [Drosophila subpulchrella]